MKSVKEKHIHTNLLPKVKKLEITEGYLSKCYITPYTNEIDYRIKKAIDKLPCDSNGVRLFINTNGTDREEYMLEIHKDYVEIVADGLNGVFMRSKH